MRNKYTSLQKHPDNWHSFDDNENNIGEYLEPSVSEEKIPPPPYSETLKTSHETQEYDEENVPANPPSPCYIKLPICIAAFLLLTLPCMIMARFMDPSTYLAGFFFVYCASLSWILYVTYEAWTKIFKEVMGNIASGIETGVHCSLRGIWSAFLSSKKGIKEAVVTIVCETKKATRS
ncbi:hypothetical protein SOMG_03966 [Schizosaccharomyces osmophilus]|uniref:Uncharacterized protein n=1 Tax=Schizosaccharomyces osmophilus TaxID=2545709 RepID=A0AAF0AXY9_9SCHI|nr:uncharacterized protein SOMG_03966 [Schizosaccharomyces osmophilus]WBW74194.1 hypothetical protein SOMG_03966 [Schizosaccharomyces osmophilus]